LRVNIPESQYIIIFIHDIRRNLPRYNLEEKIF